MAPRPDLTVVLRTRGVLLRADFRRGGEPQVARWRNLPMDAGPAVTHALREGGRAAKRVWVLDSEVWLGEVGLSGSAVAGLSDKELASPAAFEAEAVSDLQPAEAVTAVQRRRMAQADDQFLVAQAPRADVAAIAKAVRGGGSKLAGISHPAGLPEARDVGDEASMGNGHNGWRRVEFWSDSVVLTESNAGRTSLTPLGISPGSEWRRALEPHLRGGEPTPEDHTLIEPGARIRGGPSWRETVAVNGSARWMAAGEEEEDEEDGVAVVNLADDAAADDFAAAWARRLATAEPAAESATPTLRPPKAPAARWPAVVVGLLLLALSVLVVMQQRTDAAARLADLQAQMTSAQGSTQKVSDRQRDARQAKAELEAKKKVVDGLEKDVEKRLRELTPSQPLPTDRRAAISQLMGVLTAFASEDLVIQSIERRGSRHEIKGMATSPGAASRLARGLNHGLGDAWWVSPAQNDPEPGPARVVWRYSTAVAANDPGQVKR